MNFDVSKPAQETPDVAVKTRLPSSQSKGAIRVSVIIPTYNGSDTLPTCLKALMAQDFPASDFEIIVVDDGSIDDTAQVIKAFQGRAPHVRYIHQANQGPAAARNHGAQQAAGDIIMFTDDDCEPQPNWISEMHRPFVERNDGIEAVKGAYKTHQTSVIACFAQTEFESRYRKMRNLEYVDFVDTYAAAFKRKTFLELKGFDTSFPLANNEDVEFSYRMAAHNHKMVFNHNAIVYHTHPDTLLDYLKVKFGRACWRMAVYRKFPGKMQSDSYTPQSLKLQIFLSFLLFASLAVEYFLKKPFYASMGIGMVFLLSTLPFVVGALHSPVLDRFIALINQFLKRGFIRLLLAKFAAWFAGSLFRLILLAIGRVFRAITRGTISLLRAIFTSRFFLACGRGLRAVFVLVFKLCFLLLQIIWRLVCLLPYSVVLAWKGLTWLRRFLRDLTIVKKIATALNWIGRTRLVMIPLSIILLFLRGAVMGLGILWGLQSQRSSKGRFSQVLMLMFGDVIGLCGAFLAAYYTRAHLLYPLFGEYYCALATYTKYLPFVILFLATIFYLSGLYKPYKGLSQVNEFALITKSVMTTTIFVIIILFLTSAPHAKTVVLLSAFLAVVFVTALRWFNRSVCNLFLTKTRETRKTRMLIVGTGEVARLICRKICKADIDCLIVGMLDRDPANIGGNVDGYEIIGSVVDLGKVIQSFDIHEVFMALPMMSQQEVMDLVDKHSGKEGVHFHIISNLFDLISAEIDIAEHTNIPIAYLRNEQMALVHMFIKRALDIAVSTAVILVTFPFWMIIMIAIRLETDGRAIFRQERVGKDGKLFNIFKFRTMRADVDKYQYAPSSPEDRRITKVGAFLRKTSLDEFPQFLNVLNGDMSMVGPRPEMPFIVEKYKDWERQRLKVKPGLTGLWQIMGRKNLPLHESLEYDFYYIKNQSLLLDLTILIKTIPIILLGKGAY